MSETLKPGELIRSLLERKDDPEAWLAANLLEKHRARLEINHHFILGPAPEHDLIRVDTDDDLTVDAIECRNATIELLEMDRRGP